jgi:hypothetical protein
MSYLVAAVVALPAALVFDEHEDMPYWLRFARSAVGWLYVLLGVLCALAAVGVTAWATHKDWVPFDSGSAKDVANGVAYGLATLGILRFEVTSFGLADVSPARSMFKLLLNRFDTWLNRVCRASVPRRVGELQPVDLCLVAWDVFDRHVRPNLRLLSVTWHAHRLQRKQLRAMSEQVPAAQNAQQELVNYISDRIIQNKDAAIDLKGH